MNKLPLVLLLQIAEDSVETWRSLTVAHPRVGRWSLNPEYQKYIQRRFTKCVEYPDEDEEEDRDEGEEEDRDEGDKEDDEEEIIREYKLCGKWHNVDDAAIEYKDGTKEWYKHGELHRDDDFPAVEDADGNKEWYKNGKRHREGDLPAIEDEDGNKEWYKNGQRHRDEDLPAIEDEDGNKCWYKNGTRHREGELPAVETSNGFKIWYTEGNISKASRMVGSRTDIIDATFINELLRLIRA